MTKPKMKDTHLCAQCEKYNQVVIDVVLQKLNENAEKWQQMIDHLYKDHIKRLEDRVIALEDDEDDVEPWKGDNL